MSTAFGSSARLTSNGVRGRSAGHVGRSNPVLRPAGPARCAPGGHSSPRPRSLFGSRGRPTHASGLRGRGARRKAGQVTGWGSHDKSRATNGRLAPIWQHPAGLPMPAALAGQPDPGQPNRRRSRPVVYPAYAQGSCYGTNRSVAAAPGRHSGPPAPLLSTTRAAPPSGYHFRRPRSSIARTGRVFRKNRARGRPRAGAGDPERTDATLSSRLRTIGDPQRRHAGVVVDGVTVIAHQPPAAPATA